MAVFVRWLASAIRRGGSRDSCGRNLQPEVTGSPDGIVGIFDGDAVGRIVLLVQEAGDAEHPVTVRAGRVAAKGESKQFQRLFLTLEIEALDAPKDLILTGRRRQNRSRRRHEFRCPKRSEPGIAIGVDVQIKVADGSDVLFRALPAARAEWIGSNVDVGSSMVLIDEPGLVARLQSRLQAHDALCYRAGIFPAQEKRNGLFWLKATDEESLGDAVHGSAPGGHAGHSSRRARFPPGFRSREGRGLCGLFLGGVYVFRRRFGSTVELQNRVHPNLPDG